MKAIDLIPSDVKYFLLDWKDNNYNEFYNQFKKESLRDLTLSEINTLLIISECVPSAGLKTSTL